MVTTSVTDVRCDAGPGLATTPDPTIDVGGRGGKAGGAARSAARRAGVYRSRSQAQEGFTIRPIRLIAGVLIALAGGVWLLQGLNVSFAPRSFMSADPLWAVIGSVTLVGGPVLAATGLRRA